MSISCHFKDELPIQRLIKNDVMGCYQQIFQQALLVTMDKSLSISSLFAKVICSSAFNQRVFNDLYQVGHSNKIEKFLNYFSFKDEQFIPNFIEKVLNDYQKQTPYSYPMMALLLKNRSLGTYSLKNRFPFSNEEDINSILEDLKNKGSQEAASVLISQKKLAEIDRNFNGKCDLEVIQELAFQCRLPYFQDNLAEFTYNNRIHLSLIKFKEIYQKLCDSEGEQENYYLTLMIAHNGTANGTFSLNLSSMEQLTLLRERAILGFKKAEEIMIERCIRGHHLPHTLSIHEERKDFLKNFLDRISIKHLEEIKLALFLKSNSTFVQELDYFFTLEELGIDETSLDNSIKLGNTPEAERYLEVKYADPKNIRSENVKELLKFAKLGNQHAQTVLNKIINNSSALDPDIIQFIQEDPACSLI